MDCINCMRTDAFGYGRVYVNDSDGRRMALAHRVAWEQVNGEIPLGMFVCHTCDNRACINVNHLFLGTHAENMHDMKAKGRSLRGSKHNLAKLTEEMVMDIRRKLSNGAPGNVMAAEYGVSNTTISLIKNRKIWTHI